MRSRDEFLEKLHQQLRWLERSVSEYDRGDVSEAIQMATRFRVLFHDKGRQVSVMTHLHMKSTLRLLSTAVPLRPGGGGFALITLNLQLEPQRFDFTPKLTASERNLVVPFTRWWARESIFEGVEPEAKVVREDLILWAAEKDGGAHVDADVTPGYRYLQNGAGWSINLNPDVGEPSTENFKNAHFASLRQMAHEVLNSPSIQKLRG
jgi:hypothetical protein